MAEDYLRNLMYRGITQIATSSTNTTMEDLFANFEEESIAICAMI